MPPQVAWRRRRRGTAAAAGAYVGGTRPVRRLRLRPRSSDRGERVHGGGPASVGEHDRPPVDDRPGGRGARGQLLDAALRTKCRRLLAAGSVGESAGDRAGGETPLRERAGHPAKTRAPRKAERPTTARTIASTRTREGRSRPGHRPPSDQLASEAARTACGRLRSVVLRQVPPAGPEGCDSDRAGRVRGDGRTVGAIWSGSTLTWTSLVPPSTPATVNVTSRRPNAVMRRVASVPVKPVKAKPALGRCARKGRAKISDSPAVDRYPLRSMRRSHQEYPRS